jgi:hypothetical protein
MKNTDSNGPWWIFDECRACTIVRLVLMGAIIEASLVGILLLVT